MHYKAHMITSILSRPTTFIESDHCFLETIYVPLHMSNILALRPHELFFHKICLPREKNVSVRPAQCTVTKSTVCHTACMHTEHYKAEK